jgi:hypothetical protein
MTKLVELADYEVKLLLIAMCNCRWGRSNMLHERVDISSKLDPTGSLAREAAAALDRRLNDLRAKGPAK